MDVSLGGALFGQEANRLSPEATLEIITYFDLADLSSLARCSKRSLGAITACREVTGLETSLVIASLLRKHDVRFEWSELQPGLAQSEQAWNQCQKQLAKRKGAESSLGWIGTGGCLAGAGVVLGVAWFVGRLGYAVEWEGRTDTTQDPALLNVVEETGLGILKVMGIGIGLGVIGLRCWNRYEPIANSLDPKHKQAPQTEGGQKLCNAIQKKALGWTRHHASKLDEEAQKDKISKITHAYLSVIASGLCGEDKNLKKPLSKVLAKVVCRGVKLDSKGFHPLYRYKMDPQG